MFHGRPAKAGLGSGISRTKSNRTLVWPLFQVFGLTGTIQSCNIRVEGHTPSTYRCARGITVNPAKEAKLVPLPWLPACVLLQPLLDCVHAGVTSSCLCK